MPDDLYLRDVVAWSEGQAARLRRVARGERVNDVDWDNIIEEIESLGRSEVKAARALLRRAIEHALKIHGWPGHADERKWRGEVRTFLSDARDDLEPGMAQRLEPDQLYTRARQRVLDLDMETPPRPLPGRIRLNVDDLYDRGFGPDQLLARIAEAAGNAL